MAQANLTTLFGDLQRLGQSGDYERALKTCNKVLQLVPDDTQAFHCKVVSQIQLGKFDDALSAINRNQALSKGLVFEKAYAEYRLNRTKEALKTLNSQENPDARCQELRGQVLYRMENYEECFEAYKQVMKITHDDYEMERQTNFSACMAALQTWGDKDIDDLGLKEDTYELCYNAACFLLGKGQYKEAYDKLQAAEKLCRESFEDDADATEEEIEGELSIIRVQMGYCLQRLGKNSDANKLYNQVLKMKPSDIAITAVASNNIVTINKEQNIFDSKKKMKAATINALQQKLISRQRESIAMNQCLLHMYANQGDDCRRMARQLAKEYPNTVKPALIEAAQYCKDKQMPKAIEVLQTHIENQEGSPLNLKLTLAQLYLSQGQVYKACDVLKDLGDYSYKPGVVSALVTLYLHQEDADAASDVLNGAVHWYTEQGSKQPAQRLQQMIRANATFQLRHGSPQTATQMLEELRRRDPKDVKTLAQLISAYSKFDAKKAQSISRELPSPEQVAQAVDVDALEATQTVLGQRYVKKATTKTDASPASPKSPRKKKKLAGGDNVLERKKTKKKKKGKLPKNYVEGADIDKERWLPMQERSTYRGKRKNKNKKDVGKGPQGGYNEKQMQQLDLSTKPGAAASPQEGGGASAGATPKQPQPNKPNKPKGKKKKGGKW